MALTHLALSTGQGKYLCTDVRKKSSQYICAPVREIEEFKPSEFKKPLLLAFASSKALVLMENFPPLAHKLLLMHVERQLENRALMDEGVKSAITYKIVDTKTEKKLHSLVVLPENDVWPVIENLARQHIFIHTATPSIAALGALTARFTPEPLIVIMARENSSELTAFRNGIPLYMQPFPMTGPGEFDVTMINHAISVCSHALFRDFQIEKVQLLLMGERRNSIDISETGLDCLEPEWKSLPITANIQSICNWPELYGTLFARRDYSYLPPEYFFSHKIKKVNNWLAAACTLAAISLSTLAWNAYQQNISLEQQLTKQQIELNGRIGTLQKNLPASDSLEHLEHYLDILARGVMEPRLSRLFETLVLAIPETIRIEKLTVRKAVPVLPSNAIEEPTETTLPPPGYTQPDRKKSITAELETPESNQEKSMVMDITFTTEGTYRNVRAGFEKTVTNLSESFDLKNIEWGYRESEKNGYLKGQLWVQKEGTY
ncbi:hypothetical protein DGMP_22060 [Desulfomarina profundi]|uniref:Uncharacterized protein n=1 Tax=Desulfomarina profundi TaxID=2772557 RepID=A0A8D5FHN3_9BACT|nr:hypothetical protein [Desulfomarina profundi]BCL61513.1 hypothetical protein DGMP_22060 [Desulfomarina profundi]